MPALALVLPLLLAGQTIEEQEWHLDALDVYSAQRITKGNDVVVAVIDSGVDATHPDLAGRVLPGTGFGSSAGTDGTTDSDGHGTGMAAIIAGVGAGGGVRGIAPAAKILPIASAEKEQFALDVVADSIRWATDNGARVINMSLGFTSTLTPGLVRAVNYAIEKDVVLVAATGNEGGTVSAPANIGGVIAVSGTTRSGDSWKSSNIGADTVLAAPAESIVTASPTSVFSSGYAEMDGTSAASAIVSGVAALVRAKYPAMPAADVVNRLINTARDLGTAGRDEPTGYGLVDPVKALTADVPSVARNPLLPPPRTSASPAPTSVVPPPAQALAPDEPRLPFVLGTTLVVAILSTLLVVIPASRSRRRTPWPPAAPRTSFLAERANFDSSSPAVHSPEVVHNPQVTGLYPWMEDPLGQVPPPVDHFPQPGFPGQLPNFPNQQPDFPSQQPGFPSQPSEPMHPSSNPWSPDSSGSPSSDSSSSGFSSSSDSSSSSSGSSSSSSSSD